MQLFWVPFVPATCKVSMYISTNTTNTLPALMCQKRIHRQFISNAASLRSLFIIAAVDTIAIISKHDTH